MKTCTKCNEAKSLDEFHNKKEGKFGKQPTCKECSSASQKKFRLGKEEKAKDTSKRYTVENPEKIKNSRLVRNFGITYSQYMDFFVNQKGVCAICEKPETALDYRTKKPRCLAVDHCHKTGTVRGLLCGKCNRANGMLKDCVENLQNATKYLNKQK